MNLIKTNKASDSIAKNLKIFLYGSSFIGKTTFASTFPKPLLISTDGNFKHIDIDVALIQDKMKIESTSGIQIEKNGWEIYKQLVDAITQVDDYETIIVDVISDIYEMCREYVLSRNGAIHESEIKTQGKIWKLLDSEFLPPLRKLMTIDKNVIIIAHEKERDGKVVPNTISSLTQKLQMYVDINSRLQMRRDIDGNETRELVVVPSAMIAGGNRLSLEAIIKDPSYEKLVKEIKERG